MHLFSYNGATTSKFQRSKFFPSKSKFIEGALQSTLIEYWSTTGDSSYNALISRHMLRQRGNNSFFLQGCSESHQQACWGLAAMTAAERQFPKPRALPSWLSLATSVFTSQVDRMESTFLWGGVGSWSISQLRRMTWTEGLFFS